MYPSKQDMKHVTVQYHHIQKISRNIIQLQKHVPRTKHTTTGLITCTITL